VAENDISVYHASPPGLESPLTKRTKQKRGIGLDRGQVALQRGIGGGKKEPLVKSKLKATRDTSHGARYCIRRERAKLQYGRLVPTLIRKIRDHAFRFGRQRKKIELDAMHIFAYMFRMPKRLDGKTFYTASEVAKMAGVHRLTLLRWIREGKLAEVDRDRNGWRLFSDKIAHQVTEFAKGINTRSSPNQGLLFPRNNLF
jgi:excisionase family DNA binding protein